MEDLVVAETEDAVAERGEALVPVVVLILLGIVNVRVDVDDELV